MILPSFNTIEFIEFLWEWADRMEPRCACSPRGLPPEPDYETLSWCLRCGADIVYMPPETAGQLLREHGL